jgi:hypothetical protein
MEEPGALLLKGHTFGGFGYGFTKGLGRLVGFFESSFFGSSVFWSSGFFGSSGI